MQIQKILRYVILPFFTLRCDILISDFNAISKIVWKSACQVHYGKNLLKTNLLYRINGTVIMLFSYDFCYLRNDVGMCDEDFFQSMDFLDKHFSVNPAN